MGKGLAMFRNVPLGVDGSEKSIRAAEATGEAVRYLSGAAGVQKFTD